MRRNAALTVRLPGARIAPAKSTWTCGHRRLENSGTKGLSRCSIVVGRVRIITSLWRTGDDRTLPLLTLTKWTKSSLEKLFGKSDWVPNRGPKRVHRGLDRPLPTGKDLRLRNLQRFSKQFRKVNSPKFALGFGRWHHVCGGKGNSFGAG